VRYQQSDKKLQQLKENFSNTPIPAVNYAKNPDWHKEVLDLTGGVGVDIVVENGGPSSLSRA
jgi:NADPH:quinone reductase-like Zn-dependent oxidoreductase